MHNQYDACVFASGMSGNLYLVIVLLTNRCGPINPFTPSAVTQVFRRKGVHLTGRPEATGDVHQGFRKVLFRL